MYSEYLKEFEHKGTDEVKRSLADMVSRRKKLAAEQWLLEQELTLLSSREEVDPAWQWLPETNAQADLSGVLIPRRGPLSRKLRRLQIFLFLHG